MACGHQTYYNCEYFSPKEKQKTWEEKAREYNPIVRSLDGDPVIDIKDYTKQKELYEKELYEKELYEKELYEKALEEKNNEIEELKIQILNELEDQNYHDIYIICKQELKK